MAKAFSSTTIAASPGDIWALIGGFGSLPDWLPLIPKSELSDGGRIRRLTLADGDIIIERLMAFDEVGRSYSYHILQSPFPQKDYLSTLRVVETDIAAFSGKVGTGFPPENAANQKLTAVPRFNKSGNCCSESARVEWFGEFAPVGVSETEISALFQGIYDDGLRALRERFET